MYRAYFAADMRSGARWIEDRMIEAICSKCGKQWFGLLLGVVAGAMLSAGSGHAQLAPTGGQVVTPESSIEQPGDAGVRAHTNIQIFIPSGAVADPPSPWRTDDGGTTIDHPSQVPGADGSGDTARPQ